MELHLFREHPNLGPRDTGALPDHVARKIDGGEPPLKAIREWRGLSQIELADRTGIAITQITRAEAGGSISPAALRLLARGLRVWNDLLVARGP